jgi:protein O-mannosyl-transferase
MNRRAANLLGILLLLGAAFAAYWPAVHAGFIWDDNHYIQDNILLRHPDGLFKMWTQIDALHQYYPVTFLSFWIEYQLWGANPTGYHIDNIILHALTAIMLWRLLVRLEFRGALFVALLFAVHPVEVESVAWASERKNVLSGLLYMLSLAAYFRTTRGRWIVQGTEDRVPNHWLGYTVSLLLFFAALTAKSVTSTLPAVILLLTWWKRGTLRRRDFFPLLPMFIAAIAMGTLTRWVETNIVGAVGPDFDSFSFFDRLCIAGRALWFYLAKIFWPSNLSFIYPRWRLEPWFIAFAMVAMTGLFSLWLLRKRLGRGPLVAMLFFCGTLIPALGFVNVFPMRYSFVADHFQYIACIGPIALLVALIFKVLPRHLAAAMCIFIATILAFAANARSRVYLNPQTLWSDTVIKNRGSPMAHANLAQAYLQMGDIDHAESELHFTMMLRPYDASDRINMGLCSAQRGDWPQAIIWYSEALSVSPDSPNPVIRRMRAQPYFQLGTAWGALADQTLRASPPDPTLVEHYLDLAEGDYRKAIGIMPDYAPAHENLGSLLVYQGKLDEAIAQFRQALQTDPDSLIAHEQLGDALLDQRQFPSATAEFQQMLNIQPGSSRAMLNLGTVAAAQNNWDDAIHWYSQVVKDNPQNVAAQRMLAAAIAKKHAAAP